MESAANVVELHATPPVPLPPSAAGGSLSSTLDVEAAAAATIDEPPADLNNGGVGVAVVHQINLDWPMLVVGFCFSWAVAIATQSFQACAYRFSISLHLLSLAMVVAVAALFVSKCISPKFPNRAQVLEHVGVLFGVTAFFFAITLPFPLCLKLMYWTIYFLVLLAIFLCIRPLKSTAC